MEFKETYDVVIDIFELFIKIKMYLIYITKGLPVNIL